MHISYKKCLNIFLVKYIWGPYKISKNCFLYLAYSHFLVYYLIFFILVPDLSKLLYLVPVVWLTPLSGDVVDEISHH